MDPLEFDQRQLRGVAFKVAAGFPTLADYDDTLQMLNEAIINLDDSHSEQYARQYAAYEAMKEVRSRKWCNSTSGKTPHVSTTTPHELDARKGMPIYTPEDVGIDEDLEYLLSLLTPKERFFMRLHWLEGLTQLDISELFGFSKSWGSYKHGEIMKKLRRLAMIPKRGK